MIWKGLPPRRPSSSTVRRLRISAAITINYSLQTTTSCVPKEAAIINFIKYQAKFQPIFLRCCFTVFNNLSVWIPFPLFSSVSYNPTSLDLLKVMNFRTSPVMQAGWREEGVRRGDGREAAKEGNSRVWIEWNLQGILAMKLFSTKQARKSFYFHR